MLMLTSNLVITMCIVELMKPTFISGLIGIQIDLGSYLFTLEGEELGCTDRVTHSIDTGDHPPVRQPPRRIPFALRQTVREMVGAMLERGIVQPSSSPWSSPVVIVSKKDGTKRFCVDYRKLPQVECHHEDGCVSTPPD